MAQSASEELIKVYENPADLTFYTDNNVCTGNDRYRDHLLGHILVSMRKAENMDIIVSFLMESGVRLILNELKSATERGAAIRILTGSYLDITQPSALCLLRKHLGDDIELRMFKEKTGHFIRKPASFTTVMIFMKSS